MRFGYCGINYRKANQDIRDKVSFTDSKKGGNVQAFGGAWHISEYDTFYL